MSMALNKVEIANNGEFPLQRRRSVDGYWLEWSAGLLLVLALGVQLYFFNQPTMNVPQATCMGWQLGCLDQDGPRLMPGGLQQIQLADSGVEPHPDVDGALLIQATLVNHDEYVRQFPRLEIEFYDLTGRVVASRIFQPMEYLGSDAEFVAGLPSSEPLAVQLEIQDPGLSALSYGFHLR